MVQGLHITPVFFSLRHIEVLNSFVPLQPVSVEKMANCF